MTQLLQPCQLFLFLEFSLECPLYKYSFSKNCNVNKDKDDTAIAALYNVDIWQ